MTAKSVGTEFSKTRIPTNKVTRPPVRFNNTLTLPIQYFGSVEYYALMSAFGRVVIDDTVRYDKRFKSAHRMTVADTHGPICLTVPVVKPSRQRLVTDCLNGNLTWHDVAVSSHGSWWRSVEETLASAYGRTPFFEYYIDRLRPFFDETTVYSFDSVAGLDIALNRVICDILGFNNEIFAKSQLDTPFFVKSNENSCKKSNLDLNTEDRIDKTLNIPIDIAGSDIPKRITTSDISKPVAPPDIKIHIAASDISVTPDKLKQITPPDIQAPITDADIYVSPDRLKHITSQLPQLEYYQVRSRKHGFISSLSILDLIFNLGPESPLHLYKMTEKLSTKDLL